MTLIWHDWFATSNERVDSQRLMIGQNQRQRALCLGEFPQLLRAMTVDPAMLLWLSGAENTKDEPNENYARELQELFTLGAGAAYSERDVREHARALTGFTYTWNDTTGQPQDFHFDQTLHDDGTKVIYRQRGRFTWTDSLRLVLGHRDHASHFVSRLWGYFCPQPLSRRDAHAFEQLYLAGGKRIRPTLEAMLMHPLIHAGPRMVKPPIVQIAGMLRGIGRYIDTDAWAWESNLTGQMPFYPPNVAGWEANRWLNTGTWKARFNLCAQMIEDSRVAKPSAAVAPAKKGSAGHGRASFADPTALTEQAIAFWGGPTLGAPTRRALRSYAQSAAVDAAGADWEREQYPALALNALRALVVASPDYQTS
jgi:uncharacterized protein (DUF1800 family)